MDRLNYSSGGSMRGNSLSDRQLLLEKKLAHAIRERLTLAARLRNAENYSQSLQRQLLIAHNQLQITKSPKTVKFASEQQVYHFCRPFDNCAQVKSTGLRQQQIVPELRSMATMFGQRKRLFNKTAFDESREGKDLYSSSDESLSSSTANSPEPPNTDNAKDRSIRRLALLIERNRKLPPHLRSSYVVEELPGLNRDESMIAPETTTQY